MSLGPMRSWFWSRFCRPDYDISLEKRNLRALLEKHIATKTKWPLFCRRYIQIHFLVLLNVYSNFIEFRSQVSDSQPAIIWTNSWPWYLKWLEHSAWIRWLGVRVPLRSRHFLSQKHWHFHKNIRSCVKNECCCPRTVNISNVKFTSKHII